MLAEPLPLTYEPLLRAALREDLGLAGDLTTDAIVPANATASAIVVARAPGRVAGIGVAMRTFLLLDDQVDVVAEIGDGADVGEGQVLAELGGPARAILTGERVALNVLGRLCGVATATRGIVAAVEGKGAHVVCTRKTTPGLRGLEKYAVRVGGGWNHRFGLDDAVLVKDNHIAFAGSVAEAVRRVRASVGHMVKVEVEVEDLAQLEEALDLGVDAVLLDNMGLDALAEAVRVTAGRAVTEASGGVRPDTAAAIAEAGVDLLSVGWLTHSAPALDVALDLRPNRSGPAQTAL